MLSDNLSDNPKVFIANFQDIDFTPAEAYGETVFITRGFQHLNDLEKIRSTLKRYVDTSAPSDFVVLNGPSVIVAQLALLWFAKHGYINVLTWNGSDKSYKHAVLTVPNEVKNGNS